MSRANKKQKTAHEVDMPDLVKLDPNGDVIFVLGNKKKFLCSSAIMSFCSPVFRKMFTGPWLEADQISKGETPTVSLDGDDADSMEMILGILHHKVPNMSHVCHLKDNINRFRLAVCSDKYQFSEALSYWITEHWLAKIRYISSRQHLDSAEKKARTPLAYGYMLATLYLFQDKTLPKLAVKIAALMREEWLTDWQEGGILDVLPEAFVEGIVKAFNDCLDKIDKEVSDFQSKLTSIGKDITAREIDMGPHFSGASRCDKLRREFDVVHAELVDNMIATGCIQTQGTELTAVPGTLIEMDRRFAKAAYKIKKIGCANCFDKECNYLDKKAVYFFRRVGEELLQFASQTSVTDGLNYL